MRRTLGHYAGIFLVEGKGALCLSCAGLDHLSFLPRGEATLTQRATKYSKRWAVTLDGSRACKHYKHQAWLVEEAALEMMAMTEDQELTCDEVHALIDQFAEMHLRGEDPSRLLPLVQRHLEMCPDCREEYEALLEALQVASA
jgi:hypothetical protein